MQQVALTYAESAHPLIFKLTTLNGMERPGIALQYLSLYPREAEYLYPPLTYLGVIKSYREGDKTIVEVKPTYPT